MGRRGNGEGSIYRRKDGHWVGQYLTYTPKGPKYRYLYGKTRQAVAEKLTKAMAQRDSGLAFETGKLTVAEYMNKWLTESARNRLRPKTYKDYSGLTRLHIVPALGHVKLKKLTPLHIQSFYGSKLESGLSKRTVEYIHTVLHSALRQAVRWELVPRNVTEAVDPPRPESKERPTFNLDQARLFLEAARDDGWGHCTCWSSRPGCAGANCSVCAGTMWNSTTGGCTSGKPWLPTASPSACPRRRRVAVGYGSRPGP